MATISELRADLNRARELYKKITTAMAEVSNSNASKSFDVQNSFNYVTSEENMNRYWNFDNKFTHRKNDVQTALQQTANDLGSLSSFTAEVMSKASAKLKELQSEIERLKAQIAALEAEENQNNGRFYNE